MIATVCALSGDQFERVASLSEQAGKLARRRDEMRAAWEQLRAVAAGSTSAGYRTFQTIASLGSQLRSVEIRIDGLLDEGGA